MNILEAIKSGREIQTRNGYSVKILTTESRNIYPIVGLVFDGLKDTCILWDKEGKSHLIRTDDFDLVIKPIKITKWFNLYKSKLSKNINVGNSTLYDSLEEALKCHPSSLPNYIGTKSIEIEI